MSITGDFGTSDDSGGSGSPEPWWLFGLALALIWVASFALVYVTR